MTSLVKRPGNELVFLDTKPQLLGILPTLRFWSQEKRINMVAGALNSTMAATLAVVVNGPWYVVATASFGSWVIGLGLFEKWVRRQIRKRAHEGAGGS